MFRGIKNYFILFLIINNGLILGMYSFLIEPWSTEKSYTFPFKEMSL